MKHSFIFIFLFLIKVNAWSQMGLPIQQSILPKNSLVVNYDFSKETGFTRGSGTVNNIAGTASGNATIVNSPIFMNSLGFVSFDGTNQYVISTNLRSYFKAVNTTTQKSFTMSLWFYPIGLNGVIVSEHASQTLNSGFFTSNIEMVNGYIKYKVWDGTPITSSLITLNKWYHISMVYDGATLKGYLNGVSQGSQTYDRVIPTSSQNYGIGSTSGVKNMGSGAYGNFNLSQFKLHNLPLTDKDILLDYESRKDEFDYTIHSPSTNSNPTYWGISSAWNGETTFNQDHYTPWLNNTRLGWAALYNDVNQWITLNYDEPAYIKGVVIQPRANSGNQFVTKVHVETSLTGVAPWTRVVSDVPLGTNISDDARVLFPTSVFAKSVKVIPVTWTNHITMRMGMLVKPNDLITDGLVLRFDPANIKSYPGTGNTINDLSVSNNRSGTLLDNTNITSDNGGVINFDGYKDAVDFGSNIPNFPSSDISVFLWINATTLRNGWNIFLTKWFSNNTGGEGVSDFHYAIYPNGGQYFQNLYTTNTNNIFGTTAISTSTWYQVGFTLSNGNLQMYINGQPDGTLRSNVSRTNHTNAKLFLGDPRPQESLTFNGKIGNLFIYNRGLNATQVLANYNATKTRFGF